MKNKNIAAAFGWTEYPSNVEGLFLQPEEETKLEGILAGHADALRTEGENAQTQANRITELEGQLATANTSIEEVNGKVTTAENRANALQTSLNTANEKIAELEVLSGNASTTSKDQDEFEAPADNSKYLTIYDKM